MNTKISLSELSVGRTFPATWVGTFNQKPKTGEVETKKAKVEKVMNANKRKQIRDSKNTNTPISARFVLVFKWKRLREDPVKYQLKVLARPDRRFRSNGGGNETPPAPQKPTPPDQ